MIMQGNYTINQAYSPLIKGLEKSNAKSRFSLISAEVNEFEIIVDLS